MTIPITVTLTVAVLFPLYFVMKHLWPFIKYLSLISAFLAFLATVYYIATFYLIVVPPFIKHLELLCHTWHSQFLASAHNIIPTTLPQLSPIPSSVIILLPALSIVVLVVLLWLYMTPSDPRTIQIGAVARESHQSQAAPVISAPTTLDTLQNVLLATVLKSSNPTPTLPTPITEHQITLALTNFKHELTELLHHELASFAAQLSMSVPSPASVAAMVTAATASPSTCIAPPQPERLNTLANSNHEPHQPYVTFPPSVTLIHVDSPFDDNDYDSESSDEEDEPQVNVARGFRLSKKSKKVSFDKDKKKEVAPDVLSKPASSLTEEQAREILIAKEIERKAEELQAMQLTDAEKEMDLGELHCKWKLAAQQKRNDKMKLTQFDSEKLGKLTDEQKLMTKPEIRRIIRELKYKNWVEQMQRRNIPMKYCDVCRQLGTDRHVCLPTRFTTRTNSGAKKNLVIRQNEAGALKMSQVELLDQEKLNKEFEQISAMKKEIDEKAAWIAKVLQWPSEDSSMAAQASSSSSSSASTPLTTNTTVTGTAPPSQYRV